MENDSLLKSRIQTHNLTVGYRNKQFDNSLLADLNLELRAGELVCFMGPNGVGKSTLIRTLAGLQKPLSGQINYKTTAPEIKLSQLRLPQHIAVVLTDRITAANVSVDEIVSFGRYPYLNWDVKLKKEDNEMIERILEGASIQHLKKKKLYELSDGQLQMVMIARAIVQDTPIIILDEPTAHLDLNNRLEIMNLLRRLAHNMNKAILMATHELDLALQSADLIWLAGRDKNVITGIPEDLVLHGAFDSIFQFKGFDLKTGKVKHEPYRNITIKLDAVEHEYLWAKNALERNGFLITDNECPLVIKANHSADNLQWMLNGDAKFNTLQEVLYHLCH